MAGPASSVAYIHTNRQSPTRSGSTAEGSWSSPRHADWHARNSPRDSAQTAGKPATSAGGPPLETAMWPSRQPAEARTMLIAGRKHKYKTQPKHSKKRKNHELHTTINPTIASSFMQHVHSRQCCGVCTSCPPGMHGVLVSQPSACSSQILGRSVMQSVQHHHLTTCMHPDLVTSCDHPQSQAHIYLLKAALRNQECLTTCQPQKGSHNNRSSQHDHILIQHWAAALLHKAGGQREANHSGPPQSPSAAACD